jgi:hypothetical protein
MPERPLDAPFVGADDDDLVGRSVPFSEVLVQHRRGVQVVDRDVEEALDLRRRAGPSSARGRRRRGVIRLATSLAVIGTRPSSLRSCRA